MGGRVKAIKKLKDAKEDMLDCVAAKEMLLYHYSQTQGYTANCTPERTQFINSLASIGNFPKKCRSVAVSMGSGTGVTQGFPAGKSLLKKNPSFLISDMILIPGAQIRLEFEVWAVPDNTFQTIYRESISLKMCLPFPLPWDPYNTDCLPLSPLVNRRVWVNNTVSIDNAPGGQGGFHNLAVIDDKLLDLLVLFNSVVNDPNYDCFIPSYSALGLNLSPHTHIKNYLNSHPDVVKINNHLYQNFNKTSVSPFDFLYIENNNLEHIYHHDTKEGVFTFEMLEEMTNMSYPQNLFLENRTIKSGESVVYEVPNEIVAGYGVDITAKEHGDYIVANGGQLELYANKITLKPGFHAQGGSNAIIRPDVFWVCPPGSFLPSNLPTNHAVTLFDTLLYPNSLEYDNETDSLNFKHDDISFSEVINKVELFPNPVVDKIYVFSAGFNRLKIFNMKGNLLQILNFSESIEIDMSHVAPGMYLFQLTQSNGNIINKRIIKQ